jgi:hypothetical protein
MFAFYEVDKSEIKEKYKNYYHEKGRYFKAVKNNNTMCFYGVIGYTQNECEAFLMLNTFIDNVLSKEFFNCFFNHLETIGFNDIYTWTVLEKWRRIFKRFGIHQTNAPIWGNDNDPQKTWFVKRI